MKNSVIGISLALLTFATFTASAQDKKQLRVSGVVARINKEKSEMTVERSGSPRTVVYSGDTKWTKRNKPGSMDDIKEGGRVICVGTANDKKQFLATRCDARGN